MRVHTKISWPRAKTPLIFHSGCNLLPAAGRPIMLMTCLSQRAFRAEKTSAKHAENYARVLINAIYEPMRRAFQINTRKFTTHSQNDLISISFCISFLFYSGSKPLRKQSGFLSTFVFSLILVLEKRKTRK